MTDSDSEFESESSQYSATSSKGNYDDSTTTLVEGNYDDNYWRLRIENIITDEKFVSISLDKVDERCISKYTFGDIIAHGSQAVIFEACVSDKCDYVMRVVSFDEDNDEMKDPFFRDFAVRRKLMNSVHHQWYLPVKDAFVCNGSNGTLGVSISPRYTGNLLELILKRFEAGEQQMIDLVERVNDTISTIVSDLHANHVIHRDISALNFLFKNLENDKISIVLTDFETAIDFGNTITITKEREFSSGKFMDNRSLGELKSDLTNLTTLLVNPSEIELWTQISTYTRKWLHAHDSDRWTDFDRL